MPRKSLEVMVEPEVLKWARESVDMDIQTVTKKLKVSEENLSKWESGQKKPTLIQIEKLAEIYKRPLAVFFLPSPPEKPPLLKDFRSLPLEQKKPFSFKTHLAIRRARRLQSLTIEMAKSLNREIISQISRVNLSDDPEVVAIRIREQLGVKIQTQLLDWKNENDALNGWTRVIENLGILVFQMSMPLEEIRGFSLTEGEIPAIVLNFSDVINGKIFSLFHEYAHLLLNAGGICDMGDQDYQSKESRSIEKFCNHFAGAILVPKDALLNHELIGSKRYPSEWSDEILKELAKNFRVSQEVILRRLVILKLAAADFYKRKRAEWQGKGKPKGWGPPNPPKKCVQENGVPFVSLVLETHREEKITYSDVADYLAIRLKYLPQIEQLIKGKV